MFLAIVCIVASYFIGAIPTGFIVAKVVKGVDIRTCGSGNVGATNVFRTVGKRWGIFVFVADILKGVAAVTLWHFLAPVFGTGELSHRFLFLCGIVAVAGHNWTVFLNFKGGKGVATTLGMLLGLFPVPVVITTAIAFTVIGVTHYVSVGSMAGATLFPILFAVSYHGTPDFVFFLFVTCLVAVLIIVKHRSNIQRLRKGEENKLF